MRKTQKQTEQQREQQREQQAEQAAKMSLLEYLKSDFWDATPTPEKNNNYSQQYY